MKHTFITNLLKSEVTPALGCTAPVAIALAASRAAAEISDSITGIHVILSPGMYKNGWGVAVPGTPERGNALGAAYGAIGGDYRRSLQVLSAATPANLDAARDMLHSGKVTVECNIEKKGIYIEVQVHSAKDTATAILETSHDQISKVIKNGKLIYSSPRKETVTNEFSMSLSLNEILDYAEHVPVKEIRFLLDGDTMNRALANDGLQHAFGLGSGKALADTNTGADFSKMPNLYAKILTCAASDARMGGSLLPAMSTVGSGNQGITAIIPVGVFADYMAATEDQRCRAFAISHLVTYMVKTYIGRISSTCLCAIASASGAASGIVWLSGGTQRQIEYAIINVISALAGQICDGAKNACALKMGVACDQAFMAATLALNGSHAGTYDGLTEDELKDTLHNLAELTACTHADIDAVMIRILEKKKGETK